MSRHHNKTANLPCTPRTTLMLLVPWDISQSGLEIPFPHAGVLPIVQELERNSGQDFQSWNLGLVFRERGLFQSTFGSMINWSCSLIRN